MSQHDMPDVLGSITQGFNLVEGCLSKVPWNPHQSQETVHHPARRLIILNPEAGIHQQQAVIGLYQQTINDASYIWVYR